MDSLLPTPYKYILYVIGDPIQDRFIRGSLSRKHATPRFNPSGPGVVKPGGVLNVFENVLAMLDGTDVLVRDNHIFEPVMLTRHIDEISGAIYMESYDRPVDASTYSSPEPGWLFWNRSDPKGLILSDYNKGVCSSPLTTETRVTLEASTGFDFIIADTRYGTLNTEWLRYGRHNILHATDKELNNPIVTEFDYVFHTNGPHEVVLYGVEDSMLYVIATLPVPDTQVVDTVGAGDTFTASLGAFLSYFRHWKDWPASPDYLTLAGQFAIARCQEVITQQYTAIPRTRIKE